MVSGELGLGSHLEEPSLAREFGTSRAPIREAIRQLESEGLVRQVPRLGAFIPVPDRQELRDIIETRHALEVFAVARAAERITPAQIKDLQKILREFRAACDAMRDAAATDLNGPGAERLILADVAFHAAILRIAGNRRAAKIVSDLRLTSLIYRFRLVGVGPLVPHLAITLHDHHRIFRAIRSHDSAAAGRCMSAHLDRGDQPLLDSEMFDDTSVATLLQWPDTYDRLIAAQAVSAESATASR
jgi:DNA-binding GntR family transcriptional regulator